MAGAVLGVGVTLGATSVGVGDTEEGVTVSVGVTGIVIVGVGVLVIVGDGVRVAVGDSVGLIIVVLASACWGFGVVLINTRPGWSE